MAFSTEFNKYFSDRLNPYSYQKLKGMNCFGKIVNNELIHYITYQSVASTEKGKKAFSMLAGIQTIYSQNLTKKYLQANAIDYRSFQWIDESLSKRMCKWNVYQYDDNSVSDALNEAGDETIRIIVKYMEPVQDLEAYIKYCKYMCCLRLARADQFQYDSLLLIKTRNHDSFADVYNKQISDLYVSYADRPNHPEFIMLKKQIFSKINEEIIQARDRVYNNTELLEKTYAELERRKKENTDVLSSYGLI